MTIKEYRNLSPGDRREANKDIAIAIACILGGAILFALTGIAFTAY